MPQTITIKKGVTPNTPPTGLAPGELAIEMDTPTRLWVGVPAAQDASLRKLLFDSSATVNPADFVLKAGDTMTGSLKIANSNPQFILDAQGAASNADFYARRGNSNRWLMRFVDSGETGTGNAGSDWALYRYDDAGVLNANPPISIDRATGRTTLTRAPCGTRFSAIAVPPWARASSRTIARPRPEPPPDRATSPR